MALFLTALLGVGVSVAAPIDLPPSDVSLDLGGKTEGSFGEGHASFGFGQGGKQRRPF